MIIHSVPTSYSVVLKSCRLALQHLVSPPHFVSGREARLKSTLFATLMLSGAALYLIVLIVRLATLAGFNTLYWSDAGGIIGLAICYFLNRTQYNRHAFRLGIWLVLAWTLVQTSSGTAPGAVLAVPILFSSLFSSPPETVLIAAVGIGTYVLTSLSSRPAPEMSSSLGILLPATALTLIQMFVSRVAWHHVDEGTRQINQGQERYRQMFERNQAVQLLVDPETGLIVDANPAACSFYGYSYEAIKALRIAEINVLSESEVAAAMARARAEQSSFFEFRHRLASGENRDVNVFSGPVVIGSKTYLFSIVQDVTKHLEAEKALRDSELRFRTLFEQSPLAIAISRDSKLMYVNPAYVQMHGFSSAEELIGMLVYERVAPESRGLSLDRANRRAQGVSVEKRYEFMGLRKDGTTFAVAGGVTRVNLADGVATIGFFQDITERKRAEQQAFELALERHKVEVLETFIQDASHDLRTPLSVIHSTAHILHRFTDVALRLVDRATMHVAARNYVELSKTINDFAEAVSSIHKPVDRLDNNAQYLSDLVNNLLEITRLEHQPQLDLARFDLNVLVNDVIRRQQSQVLDKSQVLRFEAGEGLPPLQLDGSTFPRVVQNLLSNAIHYTPTSGTIVLKTYLRDKQTVLEVCDTGIGIAASDLPHIFERFYRADKARSSENGGGGAGLGLAIVKQIVEAHKGRIEVESVLGQGSVFRVLLPIE